MAAYNPVDTSVNKPLYFFYDCEATGRNKQEDRIIEIGAVLCTHEINPGTARVLMQNNQHEFSSLCYCKHPISPGAAEILTITLDDLKDAPKPKAVLEDFFDWIAELVRVAEQRDHNKYSPVLVAHSGNLLDYPLLFKTIERINSPSLNRKFEELNLHYTDSHSAIRQLARSDHFYQDLPGLGIKDLHQALLHKPYEGHRALPDAQALLNIFTQCNVAKKIAFFRELKKFIQSQEGIKVTNDQIPKFLKARIKVAKAEELLMKGITYEKLEREYQRSPRDFKRFLRERCGIAKPKIELLDHFKEKLDISDSDDSSDDYWY